MAVAAVLLALAAGGCHRGSGGGDGGGRRLVALPGSLHTVAGTGVPGFNGDGRPARESSLTWPDDVALDRDGNLVAVDWNNHRVRRRRADGTLETLLGKGLPGDTEGPARECLINHPTGVDWDPAGRLVAACWHNHKLKRVEANGEAVTIAGGDPGFAGDGGPAADALFDLPSSVLCLPDGSILVLDTGNLRLRRIDPGGVVTTVAGSGARGLSGDGGPALDAAFDFPRDASGEPGGKIALDPLGRVLIADAGSHTVRRLEPDGTLTRVAGTGEAGFSGDGGPATAARLNGPVDVEAGPDGSIYIADRDNDRIRRVLPDGTIETFAGGHGDDHGGGEHEHSPFEGDGGPATKARLARPSGIALDARGNLYIADRNHHTVRVVVSDRPGRLRLPPRPPGQGPGTDLGVAPTFGVPGTIDTLVGTGNTGFSGDNLGGLRTDLYGPVAVAVRPATGELFLSDWNNHRIRMVRAADGAVITVAGNGFPGDGAGHSEEVSLFHPTGIAFDPVSGDLLIADWHSYRVKRHSFVEDELVSVAGVGVPGFSGDGGPATAAALDLPSSVAVGPDGSIFVTDEANGRVRRISGGTITTFAGNGTAGFSGDGGPATEASLGLAGDTGGRPSSFLAVDGAGRLFLADTLNHRVRRVDLDGTITTVAGDGTPGFSGDGGPATAGRLDHPVAVAVDGDGTLFIADRDNHAVRRVDPAGILSTVAGDGTPGFSGDGGPAAAARLREPHGLALDAGGNLFVADLANGRVRVVWSGRDLYARVVFPLLRDTCATTACHTGITAPHGLAFDDEQEAYDLMVNAPAEGNPGWTRVVPGNPDASWLYRKIDPSVPLVGDRMPAAGPPLPERAIAVVRSWIEGGAER